MKKPAGIAVLFLTVSLIFLQHLAAQNNEAAEQSTEKENKTAESNQNNKAVTEIVITATKTKVSKDKITKSVDVISKEDMDAAGDVFLPDLIGSLPGIDFQKTGGTGQYTTIGIRGVSSSYTQFQYNGIPLNDMADPHTAAAYFTEDMFMPTSTGSIEILKGSASVLYGSRAIGGVVNIIPGKPAYGLHVESRSEFGGQDKLTENARISYGGEHFYFDFSPTIVKSVGKYNDNDYTSQYYENKGFAARAGYDFGNITVDLTSLNYFPDLGLSTSPSLDSSGKLVATEAVENEHRESLLSTTGLTVAHKVSDLWDYTVKAAYTKTERHYFWDANIDGDKSYYDGENWYADMQHNLTFGKLAVLTVGADYEMQKYNGQEPSNPSTSDYTPVKSNNKYYSTDLYSLLQLKFLDDMLMFNAGGRYVMPEVFDNSFVYDVSSAVLLKDTGTKIHAGLSTGYRTPSLYELYGGYVSSGSFVGIGNKDLKPEKSMNFEAGVDQKVFDSAKVGATAFYTDFKDRLIFDEVAYKYNQVNGKSYSEGIEMYANLLMASLVKFDLAYTYVKSEYKDKGSDDWQKQTYLPNHEFSATLSLLPVKNFSGFIKASYRSGMTFSLYDTSYVSHKYNEDGILTFDCKIAYKINENADVWVRGENILNKKYTEGGYFMPGREIYGGMKLSI